MARRALVPLLVALVVAGPATADLDTRKATVDNRIAALNDKIEAAKVREAELSREISAVSGRIQELESQVGDVSVRLAVLEADLALHRQKLASVTELLRVQTQRLRFLKRQHADAVFRLNRRLVQIYETDDVDSLDVMLSAGSFSDALDQLDYVRKLGVQDRTIAGQVATARDEMRILRAKTAATKKRVAAVTRVIAIRTAQARAARNELLANQQSLVEMRSDRRASLVHVQETAEHLRSHAAALQAVSSQLAAKIKAAQSVSTTLAVQSGGTTDSTPSASGLIWPVSGPVVSGFGWRWGRMHEGVDIAAGYGAPVAAAAGGVVIHTGWMGGYGNLVIIDHGGGLATAYAHLSSFGVGGGAVSQGQTVGYVGCTGHCFGPHLHFEVRVNGSAVDPLGYL